MLAILRAPSRLAAALLAAATILQSARAADPVVEAISETVRQFRMTQNQDGTYGKPEHALLATARVLQGLGGCAEQYTVRDGPFVRAAVETLLKHQNEDGSFGDDPEVRNLLTPEVVLALVVAAPQLEDEARAKAVAFIAKCAMQTEAMDRALVAAGAKAAPTSAKPEPAAITAAVDAALAKGATGDAERAAARMLAMMGPGHAPQESVARLSAGLRERQVAVVRPLAQEHVLAAADRLLALIDLAKLIPAAPAKPAATKEAPAPRALPANDDEAKTRIEEALAFLEKNQQNGRFGIGGTPDPGVTALALSAVQRATKAFELPMPGYVAPGLEWLRSLQKPDGGIYDKGLKIYVTSIAVEALVASDDAENAEVVKKAVDFLKQSQLDEGEGYSAEEDPYYGGFGYGSSEKPDLSNTQIAIDALKSAGVPSSDPAFKKAIEFLQRCQNRTETGAPPVPKKDGTTIVPGTDGGAVYRPGDSKAGTDPAGDGKVVARSYGSMTYALLKSYLFAGLDPADPRVSAAVDWIQKHFTLAENPGFPREKNLNYQGLFYYYLSLSRALAAYGQDELVDAGGKKHDWKSELRARLFGMQQRDGSWSNTMHSRWMEDMPELVTSYALLALVEAK